MDYSISFFFFFFASCLAGARCLAKAVDPHMRARQLVRVKWPQKSGDRFSMGRRWLGMRN